MTAREMVWDALSEVNEAGGMCHKVLAEALSKSTLTEADRAFATRLFHGTLERQITLDTVIAASAGRPVSKIKPRVLELLRLSAYQLLFLKSVPMSAACNEAVSMAKRRGLAGLSGFVNGVLRGLARRISACGGTQEFLADTAATMSYEEALCFRYAVPAWLAALWRRDFPETDIETMLAATLGEGAVTIRLNESRATMEELVASLTAEGADVKPGALPNCLRIGGSGNPGRYRAYADGWFSVQDESAVLAGNLLPLSAGMHVLDICAAPGGKTVHAADRLTKLAAEHPEAGEFAVEARDVSAAKLPSILEQLARVGLSGVTCREADASVYDPALAEWADVVIADVPCSGLGVLRRKPDGKTKTKPEDIPALAALQREIVAQAVRYVKPGGYLAYSTCTVNRAENASIAAFIADELGLVPVDLRGKLPEELRESAYQRSGQRPDGIQIFPEAGKWDGFYIAGFRKPAEQK